MTGMSVYIEARRISQLKLLWDVHGHSYSCGCLGPAEVPDRIRHWNYSLKMAPTKAAV